VDKIDENKPIKELRNQIYSNMPSPDVSEKNRYMQRLKELETYSDITEQVKQMVNLFENEDIKVVQSKFKEISNAPFQQHVHAYNYICNQLINYLQDNKNG